MRAKSVDGFGNQLDKIRSLSYCQVAQNIRVDRGEQGFT